MKRWQTILQLLSKDEFTTAESLAAKLEVSSRTVRNDIAWLNKDLKKYGAVILAKSRKGFLLQITDEEAYSYFFNRLKNQDLVSEDNRVQQLLEYLLMAADAVKIEDLCDIFFVSRSTVKNDLKKVRKRLQKYGIYLDYRANQGLKVIGNEQQLRLCLARSKMEDSVQFGKQNDSLEIIKRIIQRQADKYKFGISDFSINNLAIHIYIALNRLQSGRMIELIDSAKKEVAQSADLDMALAIVDDLETVYNVQFPQSEIYYLLLHLSSKKIISLDSLTANTVVSDDIYKMVLTMLEQVNLVFKIDFRYDLELITLLSLHLVSFQVRILHDLSSYNPMMDEIRHHYTLAYNMATIACEKLEEKYHKKITLDEIAYIALHFNVALEKKRTKKKEKVLIVCGEGRANSELLVYQVQKHFGNQLTITGTINLFQLDKVNFKQIDYVLSTEVITQKIPIPIIEINSLLAEEEVEQVSQKLKNVHGHQFIHYFKPNLFFKIPAHQQKTAALSYLCEAIGRQISLPNGFYQSVLDRENIGYTAFGNGVAIPHPIKPIGQQSFIAVGILDKKILWDEEDVQLIFLLSMKENGDENMQDLYKILSRIISSKAYVNQIIKAGTFTEFKELIIKIVESMS